MTRSLLYYARALDGAMLTTLNTIGTEKATPTRKKKEKWKRLLDYAATYPNKCIRYHANQMVLYINLDTVYLVMPKARSRIAGYRHLSHHTKSTSSPILNGPVLIICKTIIHVVASAVEVEIEGLFHNAHKISQSDSS